MYIEKKKRKKIIGTIRDDLIKGFKVNKLQAYDEEKDGVSFSFYHFLFSV